MNNLVQSEPSLIRFFRMKVECNGKEVQAAMLATALPGSCSLVVLLLASATVSCSESHHADPPASHTAQSANGGAPTDPGSTSPASTSPSISAELKRKIEALIPAGYRFYKEPMLENVYVIESLTEMDTSQDLRVFGTDNRSPFERVKPYIAVHVFPRVDPKVIGRVREEAERLRKSLPPQESKTNLGRWYEQNKEALAFIESVPTYYDGDGSYKIKHSYSPDDQGQKIVFDTLLAKVTALLSKYDAPDQSPPVAAPGTIEWVHSKPAGIDFFKSETTVAQYRACVDSGDCTEPKSKSDNSFCNWGHKDRDDHPINCVDFEQAKAFCGWAGGRLPTDQEWEAEASNAGKREYPWGEQKPTCRLAIMDDGGDGCGRHSTWPACSKPAGNSVSGLCDMGGSLWEWVSSPYEPGSSDRVVRGGSWSFGTPLHFRASHRVRFDPAARNLNNGFRCVRSAR